MPEKWRNVLNKIDDYRWEIPTSYKPGMNVPGLIYASEAMLDNIWEEKAAEQVANVAFLPGIVGPSLAMPDIHWGYGFAIGGVAGIILILLKFAALASVPTSHIYIALVLMPVLSRWAMVYAVFQYPYGRESGMGKELKSGSNWAVLPLATATAIVFAAVAGGWLGVIAMAGIWLLTVALARFFQGKFQGLTGDTYGAINEIAEFAVLLLVVLFSFNNWL